MATKPKLMADGVTGKIAIYTIDDSDPTDRDPLDAPLSYLSRILFHSDLEYPSIIYKFSGTLTLPSRSANVGVVNTAHDIFAHGLDGQPLVFGRITNISAGPVSLSGSVPVQTDTYGFGRWLSLGADETHVRIAENYITHRSSGLTSLDIDIDIWMTDFLIDRLDPRPPTTDEMLYISGTEFRAGGGRFDAAKRYIRTASSGSEFTIAKTKTHSQGPAISSTSLWRYSADGYVKQQQSFDLGAGPVAATLLTFDATTQAVRTV